MMDENGFLILSDFGASTNLETQKSIKDKNLPSEQ
jgi:serine/threonine protein kinase